MRALVVYESSFGNTARVAQAVWEGMFSRLPDVGLLEVGAAPRRLPPELELLVVGAPTHVFGMSRPATRADAQVQAGASSAVPTIGVREWLDVAGAARALRAGRRRSTPGSTARTSPARPRSARGGCCWHAGFVVTAEAESFWVLGTAGPLRDGELERARSWGVGLAGLLPGVRASTG